MGDMIDRDSAIAIAQEARESGETDMRGIIHAIRYLPAAPMGVEPCGGCGNADPSKRCLGCLHDFGTPDSAWVKSQNQFAPAPTLVDALAEALKLEQIKALVETLAQSLAALEWARIHLSERDTASVAVNVAIDSAHATLAALKGGE